MAISVVYPWHQESRQRAAEMTQAIKVVEDLRKVTPLLQFLGQKKHLVFNHWKGWKVVSFGG